MYFLICFNLEPVSLCSPVLAIITSKTTLNKETSFDLTKISFYKIILNSADLTNTNYKFFLHPYFFIDVHYMLNSC